MSSFKGFISRLGFCFDMGMKVHEESGISPRFLTLAEGGRVVNSGSIN
jgi:hypothetical protein